MLIFLGVSNEDPCFLLRCKNLFLQTQQQAKKHIGVRMLAELKKHGTMHVPQVVNRLGRQLVGSGNVVTESGCISCEAGSTQIYNYTEI